MRRGLHYTPARNLDSILSHGLRPYPNVKDGELRDLFPEAIWVYPREQNPHDHVCVALAKALQHRAYGPVAVLAVEYPLEACSAGLHPDVRLLHVGNCGDVEYHVEPEPYELVVETIPPERIELVSIVGDAELRAVAERGCASLLADNGEGGSEG